MSGIPQDAIEAVLQSETARFVQLRPQSSEVHERARRSMLGVSAADTLGLPRCVTQLGARVKEHRFQPVAPRKGNKALGDVDRRPDRLTHLFFMKRGILETPFHNMLLVSAETVVEDVDRHTANFDECIAALTGTAI